MTNTQTTGTQTTSTQTPPKRLFRSRNDRIVAGIFGGLAEYFNVDSALLRLIFLAVLIFTAVVPGIVFYILAAFVIPPKR